MLRFLCYFYLVAIILCGCTNNAERNTFKEKYDAYADPQLNSEEFKTREFPEHIENYAWNLRDTDVPVNKLEDFVDAIIRRMDAKTLPEYLKIQDEIDILYFWLTDKLSAKRAYEKYRIPSRHWNSFEAFTRDIVLCVSISYVTKKVYRRCLQPSSITNSYFLLIQMTCYELEGMEFSNFFQISLRKRRLLCYGNGFTSDQPVKTGNHTTDGVPLLEDLVSLEDPVLADLSVKHETDSFFKYPQQCCC